MVSLKTIETEVNPAKKLREDLMPAQTSHRDTLTIGRLSSLAQVDVATVRFYERSGLLEAQERTESG